MEKTTMLLTGFVSRLAILDKEFRATQAAVEYVQTQNKKKADEEWSQAEKAGDTAATEQSNKLSGLLGGHRSRMEQERARTAEKHRQELDRLTQCELALARIRGMRSAVLHENRLSGGRARGAVSPNLEELLSGKADLEGLVAQVNAAYRAGKLREAKNAFARLVAVRMEAEKLLTTERQRLRSLLAKDQIVLQSSEEEKTEQAAALSACFDLVESETRAMAQKSSTLAEQSEAEEQHCREKRQERIERITTSFLGQYPPAELAWDYRQISAAEPDLENYHCPEEMPEMLCLAGGEFDLSGMNLCRETRDFLAKYYPFLCRGGKVCLPCSLSPMGDSACDFAFSGAAGRAQAVKLAGGLAMRLFALNPAGKMKITFTDPVTLGESFAGFTRLADLDCGCGSAINGRIWTSPADIEKKLGELTEHIADITQRCLQGRYENLTEYNQTMGSSGEGYQVLILMDYPAGMTEQGLKRLEQILRLGPKCGVFTLLFTSGEQMKLLTGPMARTAESLRSECTRVTVGGDGRTLLDLPKRFGSNYVWASKPMPTRDQTEGVIRNLKYGM